MAKYSTSDPRTIVTPDAFSVREDLLGFPLASPSRRLVALGVDGLLIAILTQLPGFLLGLVAATLFFRMATGKSTGKDALTRLFRWSMGCFGSFVLVVTLTAVWFVVIQSDGDDGADPDGIPGVVTASDGAGAILGGLVDAASLATGLGRFQDADTHEEAVEVAVDLGRRFQSLSDGGGTVMGLGDIEDGLRELMPDDPSWDEDEVLDEAIAILRAEARGDAAPADPPPFAADDALGPLVESLSEEEALAEYQALTARADGRQELTDAEADRVETLRAHLGVQLAADSFEVLDERVAELEDELDDTEEDLRDTRRALTEEREGGFFNFLLNLADELGLTFGWGSVYLTIFLTWWKGQTPGKRLLNVRVLRLDGEPITWFVAFERAGGYAAGVATGLLGFAQIYWDSNRQAIHDKIVGTVVIRDGLDRVPGPWLADD